jgi:hypothetical protein
MDDALQRTEHDDYTMNGNNVWITLGCISVRIRRLFPSDDVKVGFYVTGLEDDGAWLGEYVVRSQDAQEFIALNRRKGE